MDRTHAMARVRSMMEKDLLGKADQMELKGLALELLIDGERKFTGAGGQAQAVCGETVIIQVSGGIGDEVFISDGRGRTDRYRRVICG